MLELFLYTCSEYEDPAQEPAVTQECVASLRHAVECSLRSKRVGNITIPFNHRVFNYLFKGKGRKAAKHGWLIDPADFPAKYFPAGWDVLVDQNGEGLRISYPVLMWPFLHRPPTKYVQHVLENGSVIYKKSKETYCQQRLTMKFSKTAA